MRTDAEGVFRPQPPPNTGRLSMALPDAQEPVVWDVLACYREPITRDLFTRTSAQVVLALAPQMR
ncbi:hypothetical protein, partial [Accumulibacter sp.]|uniref:hypothetical protein n=1 Tax=Accumulibacter sp. TaxID=2053492 RepID=UPI002D1FA311